MQRAGFKCVAAIDSDPVAVNTLKANLPEIEALERDLTEYQPEDLAKVLDGSPVDVIVGGPPCQGFSTARQRDGANHGRRLKEDPRRLLYRYFLRYVDFYRPRVFVIENVIGIRTAANGAYFDAIQSESRRLGPGYRTQTQIEDSWDLGVPQKRRRQLIIGVRSDLPLYFLPTLSVPPRGMPRTTLGDAIMDLPKLRAGRGENVCDYDIPRRSEHVRKSGVAAKNYLEHVCEIDKVTKLTNHVARPHSERDLRDFRLLREGESSAAAMRRGIDFEFPYDKSTFKDRYTRQSRKRACSTIVAHLSKDGLMFIHPTQNRTLTPREAARIQSFPDWFAFPSARTHAFRLIGNAVPPLVAESVGLSLMAFLGSARKGLHYSARREEGRRANEQLLVRVAKMDATEIKDISDREILKAWRALLRTFRNLHPLNALDHGIETEISKEHTMQLRSNSKLFERRYVRSGWPMALRSIADEVWRRFRLRELTMEQLYLGEQLTSAANSAVGD